MTFMKTMGIAELKAMLSETLVRVKAGEEVIVTEHSRPIARLVPLSSATPAAATQELVRAGLVKAPEKTLDDSFWQLPRARYRQGEEPAHRDLDEMEDWKLREAV